MDNSEQFISSVTQLAGALSENSRLLQDQAKATGADRPNQTVAPVAPSVQAQNNQQSFTNMDDSSNKNNVYKYWEVAKSVLGPLLGGNKLPDARPEGENVASALEDQTSILEQNNLTSTKTTSMLEQMASNDNKQQEAESPLAKEKTVVKSAERVIISDFDDKANKKFGGWFKGMKGMLGMQKKEETVKKEGEDEGMGFWGTLGMVALVGTIAAVTFAWKGLVKIGEAAVEGVKFVAEKAYEFGQWTGEKLKEFGGWVKGQWDDFTSWAGEKWDQAGAWASETWGSFTQGISDIGDSIGSTLSSLGQGASDMLTEAGNFLSEGASSVWDSVTGFFTNSPHVADVLADSGEKLGEGAHAVNEQSKKSADNLSGLTFDVVDQSMLTRIISMVTGGFAGLGDFFGISFSESEKTMEDKISAAQIKASLLPSPLSGMKTVWDTVTGWFSDGEDEAEKVADTGDKLGKETDTLAAAVDGFGADQAASTLTDGGSLLNKGLTTVQDAAEGYRESIRDGILDHIKNHPIAQAISGFTNMYTTVSDWFSDGEKEVKETQPGADKASKDLLTTQIDAIHGITGNVIEVLDKEGPTMRSAAISMMDTAREYFESTEAEINAGGQSPTGNTTATAQSSGGDKDAMRAAAINNREHSSAVVTQSGFVIGDRTSVDPKTGKLRTFDHTLFGGKEYRDLTDEEMAKFDAKHNIDAMSKAAAPPPVKRESPKRLKPKIETVESAEDKRLNLPSAATAGMETTVVAAKLSQLISVAEQQLQAIQASAEKSQESADQIAEAAKKAKNNTVVNNSNTSTSVINNNAGGLANYRNRIMSNT